MALSLKNCFYRKSRYYDINFGCPVKKVVCKGAGAGVLKDVDLMIRLTKAVIAGTHLPATVKRVWVGTTIL
jgi:tRNA-dihydrouridine synthase